MKPAEDRWRRFSLSAELREVLAQAPEVIIAEDRAEVIELALGGPGSDRAEVAYDVTGRGRVLEAEVVRCRNGVAVNMPEPYMRRRDPDCMLVADDQPSDKQRFRDRFGTPFDAMRSDILRWLGQQRLMLVPFMAGRQESGYEAMLIVPANAAFFGAALADLQGMIPRSRLSPEFAPRAVLVVAPPFRHTHCQGRQVVVHNRREDIHEVFALNLYPGPSAKKGVYGILLAIGVEEGWVTAHASTVQVVTPYDNVTTIMHEAASGGGKSEMLEYAHREPDGQLLLGENTVSGEQRRLSLPRGCILRPVTDDMASCHPRIQEDRGRLTVADAEEGWFLRVNHITRYGTDAQLERLCVQPPEPLLFLNLHAVAGATCLLWEHIEDSPGKPCPNPRVIIPRRLIPDVVKTAVEVDVRSFGIRTPACTSDAPTYGIVGVMHILPPALGWLWRLVAPRGHENPSVSESGGGMSSEGVGSYWPFATGRRVDQANLLLDQILRTPKTRYVLIPNQHIGCWRVGFMPEWISREYLARRGGARFRPEQLRMARCPLLGYTPASMMVEGALIGDGFLEVHQQPEVGTAGYDAGAKLLQNFFTRELKPYLTESDLNPVGRRIIECCLGGGTVSDLEELVAVE